MYPRISDLFKDFLGFDLPLPLYSFGLMVAIAIITATWLTRIELDRKYAAGQMGPVRVKENEKGRERMISASPSVLAWTMMGLAGVFGIAGSKLFHIIDFWDSFVQNPLGMIFSSSGLTFYGGLICAGIAIAWFGKRKGVSVPHLADSIAPGLILAYGIGRIGCYLAGDGDWGVCSSLADKPGWIPGFLWSETFPRAHVGMDPVLFNEQVRGAVCAIASPDGVYPTMLYEFAMAAALAGVLWMLRKHPFKAGWLFGLYLIFTGLERFLIEFIRVNPLGPLGFSQSQWISIGLMVFGAIVLAITTRKVAPSTPRAGLDAPVAA